MKINDPAVKMIFKSIVLDQGSVLACTRLAMGVDRQGFQKVPFTMEHTLPGIKSSQRLNRGTAFISAGNVISPSLNRIKNVEAFKNLTSSAQSQILTE